MITNILLVLVTLFTYICEIAITTIPPGLSALSDLRNNFNSTCPTSYNSPSGAFNKYYLYTRKNPKLCERQRILFGVKDTLVRSNYEARNDLVVIVHGWAGNLNSPVNEVIKSSYLKAADVNIIVVDWGIHGESYVSACLRVATTGTYLGHFLQWLFKAAGGNWNRVHLIGYSLGAHVVGNAGREVGGLPKRVTGLDPAGPLWELNPHSLDNEAGQYVEVIHTTMIQRGIVSAIGHVDFYVNGAGMQPGCNSPRAREGQTFVFL